MSHIDALMQKNLCRLFELFLTLSGKILTSAVLRDITLQFRMPVQIFVKAISHILPLWYDTHTIRHILHYAVHQQRIMRTTQNDGVYIRILPHQLIDTFFLQNSRLPGCQPHWLPQ